MCDSCFRFVAKHHGGAEIECTMLFADIRGSTTLAESMSPGEFHAVLDRFHTTAGEILVTIETAAAANLDPGLERRQLELKGKQTVTEVVSLGVETEQRLSSR